MFNMNSAILFRHFSSAMLRHRPFATLRQQLTLSQLRACRLSSVHGLPTVTQSRFLSTLLRPKIPQYHVRPVSLRVYATAVDVHPIKQRGRLGRALNKIFAFCGLTVITVGGLIIGFFVYDASTYKDEFEAQDIPIPEIALNPRRGGPKNLPVAEYLVDDGDTEEHSQQMSKPRLVVLGCGWGSVALLKNLNPDNYHVTVVSSNNYFLYTPLLPSATVGTLELRSLTEPVRRIVARLKGHFLQAKAESVDFSEKLVEVSQTLPNGETRSFYLPYDRLVIAVGTSL